MMNDTTINLCERTKEKVMCKMKKKIHFTASTQNRSIYDKKISRSLHIRNIAGNGGLYEGNS